MAGADEAFLVGERDGAAFGERGIGRLDAGRAGNGADDDVGRAERRLDNRLCAGRGLDAAARQRGLELAIELFVTDGGEARADADREFGQGRDVAAARHRLDAERLRRLLDDVDGRAADRAGRAEQHDPALLTQGHTNKPSATVGAAHNAEQRDEQRGGDEAVEPVHDAAMAGDELAGILDAEAALDRGFEEIAGLRRRAGGEPGRAAAADDRDRGMA